MRYRRPRGVNDITPDESGRWQAAEGLFRDLAHRYGYREIRTPLFEQTELFIRAVGEDTDIVSKEMYTFEDRGGRSLTLRPEGTAPVVRAYLENALQGQDRERLVKLYYVAPIFRYDRPQAGRYRQHHQCGAEALGSASPAVDAEIIALALGLCHGLGLEQVTVLLNSVGCPACRPAQIGALQDHLRPHLDALCPECQHRFEANPLRLLDCKRERCRELTAEAPAMAQMLCEACGEHFTGVQAALQAMGIIYTLEPRIVRGLDYYTSTAFELVAPGLGAQDSIGGGGRYDGLVEQCGGPPTPAVGVGLGLERLLLAQEAAGAVPSGPAREGIFVVAVGEAAWLPALTLMQQLREAGQVAEVDYRRRSVRAQLRFADAQGFAFAAILGEDEIRQESVTLRDLTLSEREESLMMTIHTRILFKRIREGNDLHNLHEWAG